ncbi:MAG TPA: hypothetical protein VGO50_19975 [Pyrinomonadaceae bacterium]|nr:hypothetical protein [Pyrinomonadaceae bacterium]
MVEATPKPPVILKQTPKPTPTPVVIGEVREDAPKDAAPGFWESVGSFFGYISPTASAAPAAPAAPDGNAGNDGSGERETIDLTYPTELTAKGSGIIELKIVRSAATTPANTPSGTGDSPDDSGIELETDRCPPGSALSACLPDHETRAVVSLVGSGFEITSDGAQNTPKKIGPGSSPVWRWSIRPKGDVEGAQEMFVTLNFTWVKGAETLGPDASRPKDFKISVVKSFFEWGTISIAGLILSLLGPILTIPWFFERGKDLMRYYRERGVRKEVEGGE